MAVAAQENAACSKTLYQLSQKNVSEAILRRFTMGEYK